MQPITNNERSVTDTRAMVDSEMIQLDPLNRSNSYQDEDKQAELRLDPYVNIESHICIIHLLSLEKCQIDLERILGKESVHLLFICF